jgi:hypothetical protein
LLIAVLDYGLRPERLKRIEAFLDGSADSADVLAITPLDCEHGCHVTRTGEDRCINCGERIAVTVSASQEGK